MRIGNANRVLPLMGHTMAESEGRWPRICARARRLSRLSEVQHVF